MKYEIINTRNPNLSLLSQILSNRGVKNIEHYLHVDDNDILEPTLFPDMDRGAKLLIKHAQLKTPTFLLIDADADGMTSSAIIYNYCHLLWPDWVDSWKCFLHSGKQHGLGDCIDVAETYQFVIIPDAGSNDYDELERLHTAGAETLILDHHETPKKSEYAITINNQIDDYPTKSLSGAGVVYKFCQHLDTLLNDNSANHYLDLAAVGMLADMMDVRDLETHRIIEKGLANIKNPLVQAIVDKNAFTLKGHLNPKGVSFNIAPIINSVMRIGTVDEKKMLFQAMLESQAYVDVPSGKRGHVGEPVPLVEEALRQASNIRAKQNKIRDARFNTLCDIIDTQKLYNNKVIAVCQEEVSEEEGGLTGLSANQVMAKYKHPILILRRTSHEDGNEYWDGSGRCPSNCGIKDFRQMLEDSGLVLFAQGHAHAFGISVPIDNLNKLIDYTNDLLKDNDFSTSYMVDDIIDNKLLDLNDIISVARSADLWTQGIEEPMIAIENIKIGANQVMVTDKIIKFTDNKGMSYVKFKPSDAELMKLTSLNGSYTLTVVGKCAFNDYEHMPQIMIEDYELKQDSLWDF